MELQSCLFTLQEVFVFDCVIREFRAGVKLKVFLSSASHGGKTFLHLTERFKRELLLSEGKNKSLLNCVAADLRTDH